MAFLLLGLPLVPLLLAPVACLFQLLQVLLDFLLVSQFSLDRVLLVGLESLLQHLVVEFELLQTLQVALLVLVRLLLQHVGLLLPHLLLLLQLQLVLLTDLLQFQLARLLFVLQSLVLTLLLTLVHLLQVLK